MSKELAASGQLSAEDIERIRSVLTGNRIQAYKAGEQGVADVMTRIIDFQFNTLCDMALRSLTAQVKCCCGKPTELGIVHREKEPCFHFSEAEILTARDEGIEAAAKLIRKRLDGIYEDHSYTEQDTGAVVIDNAEIEGRANELEELEEEIRALAQDQRSEQSSGLNGDVSSVSPRSSSSAPNGVERTGNSASIDTVTGRRDGHPTEQDAAELLREALDAYDHIVVKTGYQGDFDTSAGRAHLARKEPK